MTNRAKADVRTFPSLDKLSEAAADRLATIAQAAVDERDRFTIALSGGHTPRTLYHLLATRYRATVPWRKTEIFWGDERFVPPEDPRSNYHMAKETLLSQVPIPGDQVHPMPMLLSDIDEAAESYEETVMSYFRGQWPRFDLILLGMGADGHIASLFPYHSVLEETARVVASVRAPDAEPPLRLTLTLPAINHAANVHFICAGKDKASAVRSALSDQSNPKAWPAAAVRPVDGALVWWLDTAASPRQAARE